jgi:hypothetical protein
MYFVFLYPAVDGSCAHAGRQGGIVRRHHPGFAAARHAPDKWRETCSPYDANLFFYGDFGSAYHAETASLGSGTP